MRRADDPAYAEHLGRLRIHEPTQEDIELLQSRIGAPLLQSAPITIIVRRNTLPQASNDRKLSEMTSTRLPTGSQRD